MKKLIFLLSLFILVLFSGCTKNVTDYDLTVEFQDEYITGKYTGILIDDVASGTATFTYNSDDKYLNYKGGFKNGQFSGEGTLETNFFKPIGYNIGEYKGDVIDGIPKGHGTFTSTNNENETYTYTGAWDYGMFNGYGKKEWKNDEYIVLEGNWRNGEFAPTKSQYFSIFKNSDPNDSIVFSITDNAIKYLDNNDNLFPANSFNDITNKVDNNIEFKHLMKNINSYGNELVKFEGGRVGNINEYDNDCGYELSIIQVSGGRGQAFYYIYYFGKLDDIYKGDIVNIYGLPIATTSFTNVSSTTTEAVVMAGSYITKK